MQTFSNRALPASNRDISDAMPDYISGRAGMGKPRDPLAQEMLERNVTLADIAAHFVGATRDEPASSIIQRALGSADFGESVNTAFRQVAVTSFDLAISGVMQLVRTIEVPNFKPQRLPNLNLSDLRDQPENSDWLHTYIDAGAVLESQAAVQTKGANVVVTRQALVSDSAAQIGAIAAAYGNAAGLAIASAIASALSSTANLDDGYPLFSAATGIGNYVAAGGAPSLTTLSAAAANLWRRPTSSGSIAGVAPAFLVIPPELIADASTALIQTYGDINSSRGNVDLVILPHLTSTTEWYLLGRPATAPVLGMLTLQGARPLRVERIPTPMNLDGIALRAHLDFRIVRLSRLGAFKNHGT